MSLLKPTAREVLLKSGMADFTLEQKDAAEKRFFNQIKLANGTRKTTTVNRLTDINRLCNRILKKFDGDLELLDIGISSGVTTIEWMDSLNDTGVKYHLDGFDLCLDGYIRSVTNWFHVLCDSEGIPLEFELFGSSVDNYFGETFFRRIKRVIPVVFLRSIYRVSKVFGLGKKKMQPVRLVTHRLTESEKLRIFEFDISRAHELDKRYNMIRAANILNVEYFDREFLLDAVTKLVGRLVEGGFLCVVRTHADGSNHATVFQESRSSLDVVHRIGNGSEIEDVITEIGSC